MKSGFWHAKTEIKLEGIPLPSSEDDQCVTKGQAKDVKATLTKELKKNGCKITQWKLKGKDLSATVECKNKDIEAKGTLHGSVTSKNYELSGDAKGKYKMIPSAATLKLTGEWVGTCPE